MSQKNEKTMMCCAVDFLGNGPAISVFLAEKFPRQSNELILKPKKNCEELKRMRHY
jgi:hypothetical protein